MTLDKTLAWAFAIAVLTGCPGDIETGDSSDTAKDTDTEDGCSASHAWDTTGITVTVTGCDATGWDFGMAETGSSNGWGGEDCLTEVPAGYENVNDAGYSVCHGLTATGGYLQTVYDPEDVSDGSTTLFNNSLDAGITYVLFDANGTDCMVWGDDGGYYAAYGCTEL